MAYNALNNLIDAYIYANGVQAITGQILNGVLKQMVSQLGSGYHLMGVADPETVPASNDYAMAYFAATAGEYTDFGGITLAAGEVAVLLTYGNGSWEKRTIYNVPTGTADLENTANFITNAVTDLINYYTKEEIDDTLENYPTLEALATALADYYTKTEIDTQKAETDAALADRYTKSETDTALADYYKKTETYDKDEVDSIVAALSRQEYIIAWDGLTAPDVSAIPAGVTVTYSGTTYTGTLAASASTVNKIYMVWNGTAYDMYGTSQDGGYSWVPMGTTTVDLSQYATKAEVSQLEAKVTDLDADLNGASERVFLHSEFTDMPGTISGSTFLSEGVYGTNNDYVLIPVSAYRGRSLRIVPPSGIFSQIAFLVSDALVNGSTAPFCSGYTATTNVYSDTTFTIPGDCNFLYVYVRHGSDPTQYPATLSVLAIESSFYDKDEIDGMIAPINSELEQIEEKLSSWVAQDTTTGPYHPTNQNTGNNGARVQGGTIYAASSANALVTDKIEIDHTKRYKLRTLVGTYFDGLAYYNGNTYVGNDVFHASADTVVEAELTIPAEATHFRLASANVSTAYTISILTDSDFATEAELAVVDAKVEQAQTDIQDLYGIAEAAGTMDVARAVRYIPTKELYLGADIVSLSGATYDPTYWSIENGVVKYLGGGGTSYPFVFGMQTTEGARYLAELVASVDTPGFENLFLIKIGDGSLVDTYNGGPSTRGGLISDGGSFTIVPISTKAFNLTSVKLSQVLNSATSQGYERTVVVDVDNVSCGNSAESLIDGKWNVAVGPNLTTMANNVGGSRSIAIGYQALRYWRAGMQNIAIGTFAAHLLEDGNYNIAIGADAMWQAKEAESNIVIGRSALGKTGLYSRMYRNIAIGVMAMSSQDATTEESISIGYNANAYGASRGVFIGNNCGTNSANRGVRNCIVIGRGALVSESNCCVLGNTEVTTFILGSKKLVFNTDGTVSWTTA